MRISTWSQKRHPLVDARRMICTECNAIPLTVEPHTGKYWSKWHCKTLACFNIAQMIQELDARFESEKTWILDTWIVHTFIPGEGRYKIIYNGPSKHEARKIAATKFQGPTTVNHIVFNPGDGV